MGTTSPCSDSSSRRSDAARQRSIPRHPRQMRPNNGKRRPYIGHQGAWAMHGNNDLKGSIVMQKNLGREDSNPSALLAKVAGGGQNRGRNTLPS